MERLIQTVNKLQDTFLSCGLNTPLDLPQIMVVGAQSSGKSSVLEALVGIDFLPRGTGIVTRRPILIQMIQIRNTKYNGKTGQNQNNFSNGSNEVSATDDERPWAEFLHIPGKKFYDFSKVMIEIQAETDRVAGKNKAINPKAISIKVYSTQVVDLTLIDLPGLTRIAVGDQPEDIERLIRAMIYSYIERENAIILAVHPANSDLATSDALQLAKKADPQGLRTIGVITKLDIMDQGTNGLDMLLGKVIPLTRGYIGVVNRSQASIDANMSLTKAREDEARFFAEHPLYKDYSDRMGSKYLASFLSAMLMEHIRLSVPSLRTQIAEQLSIARRKLASFGPVLNSANDPAAIMLHLLTTFGNELVMALDGQVQDRSTTALYGGARINYVFNEVFGESLAKMDPFEDLTAHDIRTAMRNAMGHRNSLFVPEAAFELLARRQIRKFEKTALSCVGLVYDELLRLAIHLEDLQFYNFDNLKKAVNNVTMVLLRNCRKKTMQQVEYLISMELSFINTKHPDFIGCTHDFFRASVSEKTKDANDKKLYGMTRTVAGANDKSLTPKDRTEIEMITCLLQSYFGVVRKNIQDMVPKAIMCFMVNEIKSNLQKELVTALYKPELFHDLMKESSEALLKRKETSDIINMLENANDIMNEI